LVNGRPGSHGNAAVAISPVPNNPTNIEPALDQNPVRMLVSRPRENDTIRMPVMRKLAFMITELSPVPNSLPYWVSRSYPGLNSLAIAHRDTIKKGVMIPDRAGIATIFDGPA